MKMMGIIFSNIYDEALGELTRNRTLASLPFGGRYRLIDFVLSNMVNSGITNVGVITKANYQSLLDHLGKGKEWDLDRKKDGLFILPPFGSGQKSQYTGKIEALIGTSKYLQCSVENYVLVCDSNVICSINYQENLKRHIKNGADITIITNKQFNTKDGMPKKLVVEVDENNQVIDALVDCQIEGEHLCSLGMFIIKRELLLKLIFEANAHDKENFEKDIIQKKYSELKIMSDEFKSTALVIDSISTYYEHNMALLDKKTRDEIFFTGGHVYTKNKDEIPTLYGDNCKLSNSLIADGCIIDGVVEDSILFRGVKIKKGAVVKNCILMQTTEVCENAELEYIISDKDVTISEDKRLIGAKDYPMVIGKNAVIS